jgi:hypothetical protein
MPQFGRLIRISVRVVTGLLALGLLGYSIFHAGPALAWKQIHAVKWGLGVIIVMGGFSQFTKSWTGTDGNGDFLSDRTLPLPIRTYLVFRARKRAAPKRRSGKSWLTN